MLTVLYSTVLYCTVPNSTFLYRTLQYSTERYFTVQHWTVLYCAVLNCTALNWSALQSNPELNWYQQHCTNLHCTALLSPVLYFSELHCTVFLQYCFTILIIVRKVVQYISTSVHRLHQYSAVSPGEHELRPFGNLEILHLHKTAVDAGRTDAAQSSLTQTCTLDCFILYTFDSWVAIYCFSLIEIGTP